MNFLRRILCLLLILALTAGMGGVAAMSALNPSDDVSVVTCCDTTVDPTPAPRERWESDHGHCGSGDEGCMDPYCSLLQAMLTVSPLLAVARFNVFEAWATPTLVPVYLPGLERPPRLTSAC